MKLTIDRAEFVAALARVKTACAGQTTLAVLQCVLLEAKGDTVKVTGSNLDHYLSVEVTAEIEKPGSLCVSVSRLLAGVGKMKGDELEMVSTDSKKLTCESDGASVTLLSLAADEYPPTPPIEGPKVMIEALELVKGFLRTTPFQSTDQTRYQINGVYLHNDKDKLQMVATNGHCLSLATLATTVETPGAIIPTAVVKLLLSLLEKGEVELQFGESLLSVRGDRWHLVAKLVEGNYPAYKNVIPPKASTDITVDRRALMDAIPIVASVFAKETNSVKIEKKARGEEVKLSACGADIGEAVVSLEAEKTPGEVAVAYSSAYLGSALNVLTEAKVNINLADNMSPCRIEEPGVLVVIMPLRIS